MSVLKSIAFGSALLVAGLASSAPANADSFGFYAGPGGVGVQVSHHDGRGYGYRYNPCNDYRFRRNHPYCWNDGRYAYNNGYRYGHDYDRDDRGWRNNDHRRHERWERRHDRREDWRENHRGRDGRWRDGDHDRR